MVKRVLLVDDCIDVLYGLRLFFQKTSWEVAGEAETCAAALQFIRTTPIDLVLLDLNLPDGHGLNVLPQIKSYQPNVPVVVHSQSESEANLLLSHKLGAHGYLVKGLDPFEVMLDTIQRVSNGETAWTKDQMDRIERHTSIRR